VIFIQINDKYVFQDKYMFYMYISSFYLYIICYLVVRRNNNWYEKWKNKTILRRNKFNWK